MIGVLSMVTVFFSTIVLIFYRPGPSLPPSAALGERASLEPSLPASPNWPLGGWAGRFFKLLLLGYGSEFYSSRCGEILSRPPFSASAV
jgi:hypothetical protein